MEMITTYSIEYLSADSVTIITHKRVRVSETEVYDLPNHAHCYSNLAQGRQELEALLVPEHAEYYDAVLAVWGDTPLPDPVPPEEDSAR